MVTSCNTETGPEVVDDRPKSSLPLQRGPESGNTASERDTDNEDDLTILLAVFAVALHLMKNLR